MVNPPTNQPTGQPLRLAIWAAVSSKPQAAGDKTSLADQEAAGRKLAAALHAHVVRVYTIPGHTRDLIFWSDAEAAMPAYRQLREDIEAHAFDVLFALDPDRLGRDPALSNQVISLVEKSGAEVYLASAPHPIGQATISHRYIYAIQTVRAQEDQRSRVEHHRHGITARVRRGLVAARWPIGYRQLRDPLTGQTTGASLDPDQAPAVQLATRLFIAGEPYSRIRTALNTSPYHPPHSPTWSYSTIRKILHNDTYAGYPYWGHTAATETSPHYPALWDPDTHAAVIRERQRRNRHRYHKSAGSPLAGVVFCTRCGHAMSRYNRHGKTYTLRCSTHNHKSQTGIACHYNEIKESTVIAAITGYLATLADPAALARALATTDNTASLRTDLVHVDRRLNDLSARRERLALALAAGQMDPQIYRSADDTLLADVETLQEQHHHLQILLAAAPDLAARRTALQAIIPIFPDLIHRSPPAQVRTLLQNAGLRIECEAGAITSIQLT